MSVLRGSRAGGRGRRVLLAALALLSCASAAFVLALAEGRARTLEAAAPRAAEAERARVELVAEALSEPARAEASAGGDEAAAEPFEPVEPARVQRALFDGRAAPFVPRVKRGVLVLLVTPRGTSLFRGPPRSSFRPRVLVTREPLGAFLPAPGGSKAPVACAKSALVTPDERERGALMRLELSCERPLWVSLIEGERVLDQARIQEGTREVEFVLDPAALERELASVRLRAVDASTGEPVAGARVVLSDSPGGTRSSLADAGGRARLEGLRPLRFELAVGGEGYALALRQLELAPGAALDLGDVALARPPPASASASRLRVSSTRPLQLLVRWPGGVGALHLLEPRPAFPATVALEPRTYELCEIGPEGVRRVLPVRVTAEEQEIRWP